MGTVSRDAVEPWAGNAGFTERRKDGLFYRLLYFHLFYKWMKTGWWKRRGDTCCNIIFQIYSQTFCVEALPNQNHQEVSQCYIIHLLVAFLTHAIMSIISFINNKPHSREFYMRSLLISSQKRSLWNLFISLIKLHDCALTWLQLLYIKFASIFSAPYVCEHAKQDCAISWRKQELTYDLVFMPSVPTAAGFQETFEWFHRLKH